MATEAQLNEEEDNVSASQPLAGSSAPLGASGGGAAPSATPGAMRPASPSARPNIQQYLKANVGAGDTLAGQIQQNYGQQTEKFNKQLQEEKGKFEGASNPLQQKLGQGGQELIQTAFKDPSKLLNQQGQLDQQNAVAQDFTKLRTGAFGQDVQGLGQQFGQQKAALQAQLGNLGQRADMAKSEGGRFQLLRENFSSPTYTRGQQRLDQLFLQAQPGVARSLAQNMGQQQAQAGQALSAADAEAQAKLKALQGMVGERSQQIGNILKGGLSSDLETDISGRGFDDIKASSEAAYQAALERAKGLQGIQTRLQDLKLTDADRAALGLTAGTSVYDLKPNEYISNINANPTLTGVANADEFARYRALQQLAGDTSGDIFGGATEAGGWKPFEFDKAKYDTQLADRRKFYEETEPVRNAQGFADQLARGQWGGSSPESWRLHGALQNVKNADDLRRIMNSSDFKYITRGAVNPLADIMNQITNMRNRKV